MSRRNSLLAGVRGGGSRCVQIASLLPKGSETNGLSLRLKTLQMTLVSPRYFRFHPCNARTFTSSSNFAFIAKAAACDPLDVV